MCGHLTKEPQICRGGSADSSRRIDRFARKNRLNDLKELADLQGIIGRIAWKNRPICQEEAAESADSYVHIYVVDMNSVWFETTSHAVLTALHTIEALKESLCHVLTYIYVYTYER